jgi:hypothetical protein
MDVELIDRLRDIMSEGWDEDDLAEWAQEVLDNKWSDEYRSHHDERIAELEHLHARGLIEISTLKPLVTPYRHPEGVPALPKTPDGALHGIGFVFDGDRDERVLVAIDLLKSGNKNIVAMEEHEGVLTIYSLLPTGMNDLSVCGDYWLVEDKVASRGEWVNWLPLRCTCGCGLPTHQDS